MSAGPVGQSKLTTGTPLLMASRITIGKPSDRELRTNIDDCSSRAAMWRTWPRSITFLDTPCLTISPDSGARRGPEPHICRVHSGACRTTCANVGIRRSKPFWLVSRPAASTIWRDRSERGPPSSGTAFGMLTTRVAPFSSASYLCRSVSVRTTMASSPP